MFRAYSPEQDRLVAVKLFRLDLPPERGHQLVAAFEQLIAADLTHPAVAAPLAAGLAGVNAYLAQDFVAADSLDIVIRDHGPAPAHEAVRVATQIGGALDFAAVVNVLHGALHPRDVLVAPDDTRVTGLGVAQALERAGASTPVRRPYTAPERAAGTRWDRRADVFSLAALVYELLCGRRVAGTGDQAAAGLGVVSEADSALLRTVFARALAERPDDRYPTALAFAEALRDAFPSFRAGPTAAVVSSTTAAAPDPRPAVETAPRLPLDDEPNLMGVGPSFSSGAPLNASADAEPLTLADAEAARYRDVETAPSLVPENAIADGIGAAALADAALHNRSTPHAADALPTNDVPQGGDALQTTRDAFQTRAAPPPARRAAARAPSSRAAWPIAIALIAGAVLGFVIRDFSWTRSARESSVGAGVPDATSGAASGTATSGTGPELVEDPLANAPGLPSAAASDAADAAAVRAARSAAPAPAAPAPQPRTPPAPARRDPAVATPPPAVSGSLLVRSTPAGATVLVDGRPAGRTPATVRNLGRGTHTVRVSREGYVAQERRITLSSSQPSQSLTMELVRDEAPASSAGAASGRYTAPLLVESRPAGASVFLNGKLIGKTPLMMAEVPVGSHAVRLELDGYTRWTAAIRVVAGERNRIAASLER